MRTLGLYLLALGAVIVAMLLGHWFGTDPGHVLIRVAGWRLETTLAGLLLAGLTLGVVGYLGYLLLRWPWRALVGFQRRRARNYFDEGLSALYEGRYKRAERALVLAGARGRHPQLAWLGAARAAFEQNKWDSVEAYLKRAEALGNANSVKLARAQLLHDGGRHRDAADALNALLEVEPRHAQALKLLSQVERRSGNVAALEARLPQLIKARALPPAALAELTAEVLRERLRHADSAAALDAAWREVPREERREPKVLLALGEAAARLDEPDPAADLLIAKLRESWDDELIDVLGRIAGPGLEMRLRKAEAWLNERPQSAPLLLALARMCRAQGLWGKARDYFQSSLSFKPSLAAFEELGELLAEHGEPAIASACYRNALRVANGLKPEPLSHAAVKPQIAQSIDTEVRSSHGVPLLGVEPRGR
jgi:HemY protein